VIEDRVGLAEVATDHADGAAALQQRAAVQFHHGVVVHVHHVSRGDDLLRHLVGVPDGRQSRADVDELPDVMLRYPLGRALVEAAVGPGRVPDLRRRLQDLLGGEPVNLEVVVTLQHVVVDPGRRGPPRVDARRYARSLAHVATLHENR